MFLFAISIALYAFLTSVVQTKLQISQGYGNEVNVRLNVDSTEYSWMEKQQAKLQSDYEKGLAQLVR